MPVLVSLQDASDGSLPAGYQGVALQLEDGGIHFDPTRAEVRDAVVRRLRDLEAEDAFEAPSGFMPRKLRATFVSAVGDLNAEAKLDAEGNTLRFYVGQKPTSVLTAHYDVPSLERLGKIAGLAQGCSGRNG